jgi:hypothetical protein
MTPVCDLVVGEPPRLNVMKEGSAAGEVAGGRWSVLRVE